MAEAEMLHDLIEADRWLERVRQQREHLPEQGELDRIEESLRIRVAKVRETEDAVMRARQAYDEQAERAERLRQRHRELERALHQSSGSRDLVAIEAEARSVAHQCDEADERALDLLAQVEDLEVSVREQRHEVQPDLDRRRELRETLTTLRWSLGEEAERLATEREQLSEGLSPTLRARYERARGRAGVAGGAFVVDGRCDGCRLALSPLDLDRFRRRPADEVVECPSCGRILVS
ncbi:MAG: zinc ribbon domain-containing protein [Acidimicrobiales bacterium]